MSVLALVTSCRASATVLDVSVVELNPMIRMVRQGDNEIHDHYPPSLAPGRPPDRTWGHGLARCPFPFSPRQYRREERRIVSLA